MKLFMLTQEIDFSSKEFENYDRNSYPQQYIKNIIEERIPDSKVVLINPENTGHRLYEISKRLNDFVPTADQKLQEYINDYNYALNLAKQLGLMNERTTDFDTQLSREIRNTQRKAHIDAMRERSPEYGIRLAGDCFTYNQPRAISTFTDIKINTDIAGIIVPIGHADHNDLWQIIHGVKGLFSEQIKQIKAEHDKNIKSENPSYREYQIEERNRAIEQFFYTRFQIPVFESFKYAPGDRFNNHQIGRSMLWKETEYNCGREDFIKFALNKWIDVNFPKEKYL